MKRTLSLLLSCLAFVNIIPTVPISAVQKDVQNSLYEISSTKNFTYDINDTPNENIDDLTSFLGEKGVKIAKMKSEGLPVPESFVITTEAFKKFHDSCCVFNEEIITQVLNSVSKLEKLTNKKFYYDSNFDSKLNDPALLLCIRIGTENLIPCMPEAILNVGLNEFSVKKMIEQGEKPDVVYDMYLKFIEDYSEVISGISRSSFENISGEFGEKVLKYKNIYKEKTGTSFPENSREQLIESVKFIFKSWNSVNANNYRQTHKLDYNIDSISILIQCMKFVNLHKDSGTGVMFSRNPTTGENNLYGDFAINIDSENYNVLTFQELKENNPRIYESLKKIANKLESIFKDMQYVEFIVEDGCPYVIKTLNGKREIDAAVKIAVDLVSEGKMELSDALLYITPERIKTVTYNCFKPECLKKSKKIAQGTAASPGAASGVAVFSVKDAQARTSKGENVILIKKETSAEDVPGIKVSQGLLTTCGGMTSHASVVARGMGKCCVTGCEEIKVYEKSFSVGDMTVNEGEYISIDGTTGKIYVGEIETTSSYFSEDLEKFLSMTDSKCKLSVFANADNAKDVCNALKMGAKGVGLCRTEHMFFEPDRITFMQQMILASSKSERSNYLAKLLPLQQKDFKEMFTVLQNKPLTIRLIDPPLHEFLPKSESEFLKLSEQLNVSVEHIQQITENLKEFNPMMGHRGCRLLISYPEIIQMQVCAIIGAAIEAKEENPNCDFIPEIMIPFVGDVKEVKYIKKIINETADNMTKSLPIKYKIGVMIETPRAALLADEIAREVDFFSFGTNDLTQLTFGFSRDDSQKFLNSYYENNILKSDPFINIDSAGVGTLIKIAVQLGKKTNPDLKIGICGEHGGDPKSINFFSKLGLDYISCSPFSIPVARLSVARNEIGTTVKNIGDEIGV